MYISKSFTPQQLFQMVWETPVLVVARQIGVSDVGLAKACRKAGVALPPRGYWAKSQERRPKRPMPPLSVDTIEFRILDPEFAPEHMERTKPVNQQVIYVPAALLEPHPLVARWLTNARRSKEIDGYLLVKSVSVLDTKISAGAVNRCALLFDTLIKASERLGYSWHVRSHGTEILVSGEKLMIRILERLERHEIPRPASPPLRSGQAWKPNFAAMSAPRYRWSPTGELTIHIDARTDYMERKNWKDTKSGGLEGKLGQLLAGLLRLAASVKSLREKNEARDREWRHDEYLRQERIEQQRRTDELRSRLAANVVDWGRAQQLRAFINATIDATPSDEQSQQALALWLAWAMPQVDLIDPLSRGIDLVCNMAVPQTKALSSGTSLHRAVDATGWWD